MTWIVWFAFIVFIVVMLALDLGVFHRRAHAIRVSEAMAWTVVWVVLALAFNVLVYFLYERNWLGIGSTIGQELNGSEAAIRFFTGYLIEKSLSLDNIFVIALIFSYFSVPLAYQHRVLFWGVIGALVMRGVLIVVGAALIHRFAWTTYVLGGLLIITAAKMLVARHDNLQPMKNPLVRIFTRFIPTTDRFDGARFFTRQAGATVMTPLGVVLITVESTDLLFAIDSVPAIFAVTTDPFLVFTSNVFAILGLRSLYFALAGVLDKFRYLKMSLVFLLAFVGVKMILAHHYKMPIWVSLAIIAGILGVGLLASIIGAKRDTAALVPPSLAMTERQ